MFENYNDEAVKSVLAAKEGARMLGREFIETDILLLGLSISNDVFFNEFNINSKTIYTYLKSKYSSNQLQEVSFSLYVSKLLESVATKAKSFGHETIKREHILLMILNEKSNKALDLLKFFSVDINKLKLALFATLTSTKIIDIDDRKPMLKMEKALKSYYKSKSRELNYSRAFLNNLSEEVILQKSEYLGGRYEEIKEIAIILSKKKNNCPMIIGEKGIGKTMLIKGLVKYLAEENGHDSLHERFISEVNLKAIQKDSEKNPYVLFETKVKIVFTSVLNDPRMILLLDNAHIYLNSSEGPGMDLAYLKPLFLYGDYQYISVTTRSEYIKFENEIPKKFHVISLEPLDIDTTIKVLHRIKFDFQKYYNVLYHYSVIEQTVNLSEKYVLDRYLPEKAISLLDEVGARVNLKTVKLQEHLKFKISELSDIIKYKEEAVRENKFKKALGLFYEEEELKKQILDGEMKFFEQAIPETKKQDVVWVYESHLFELLSKWTKTPIEKMSESKSDELLHLEEHLHKRIIGQKEAVKRISKAIRRAKTGLRNKNRPIASFIFAGPTGVGKTELTKAVSSYMFGDTHKLVRLDMSEYMQKHDVSKLIGAPPGYVGYEAGGQLTDAVLSNPHSVVLFDEIEKADLEIFDILLQLLDDGRLTDGRGQLVDFTNTIIIMTTNLGAKKIESETKIDNEKLPVLPSVKPADDNDWIPKREEEPDTEKITKIDNLVKEEIKQYFRPEFLNRLDGIITFDYITLPDAWEICGLMIKEVKKRLEENKIFLNIDNSAQSFLTFKGFEPIYGARPLRRSITENLENIIAEKYLQKEILPESIVNIRRKEDLDNPGFYLDELDFDVSGNKVKEEKNDNIKIGNIISDQEANRVKSMKIIFDRGISEENIESELKPLYDIFASKINEDIILLNKFFILLRDLLRDFFELVKEDILTVKRFIKKHIRILIRLIKKYKLVLNNVKIKLNLFLNNLKKKDKLNIIKLAPKFKKKFLNLLKKFKIYFLKFLEKVRKTKKKYMKLFKQTQKKLMNFLKGARKKYLKFVKKLSKNFNKILIMCYRCYRKITQYFKNFKSFSYYECVQKITYLSNIDNSYLKS